MSGVDPMRTKGIELNRRWGDLSAAAGLAVFIFIFWCFQSLPPSLAQGAQIVGDFQWQKDNSTGAEFALSRSELPLNFLDVGDLSYYSLYLVQETVASLSSAAGIKIDTSLKNFAIVIVHDTNVFSRLKADKRAFSTLGIPDAFIEQLQKKIDEDATTKCITLSAGNNSNDISFTAILLSEKFDSCLIGGLFQAFGVYSLAANLKALSSVCILYEARRRGLRDRNSLSLEAPKLIDLCVNKTGEAK